MDEDSFANIFARLELEMADRDMCHPLRLLPLPVRPTVVMIAMTRLMRCERWCIWVASFLNALYKVAKFFASLLKRL